MKTRFIITMFLLATTMWSAAQLLTSDPEVPLANQEATIFFNASLGNGDLEGYTGDVYAHTGVITENSTSGSDWKYVKTEWGQNTPETRMTRTGQNLYMITIGPSVREYYEVPENETILQMAFVFRSAEAVGSSYLEGKTASGGDIFLDVLEPGSITFIQPENRPSILELNDDLVVEALAFEADSTALFENNVLIKKDEGNHIIDTLTATDYGKTWVKAMAWNGMETIVDSFYYYVRQEPTILPLPGGIRDGINYIDEHTVVLSLFAPKPSPP